MHILKKLLIFITFFIFLLNTIENTRYASQTTAQSPMRVAVFLYSFNPLFFYSPFRESLENIQNENQNKVEFTFFDSKENQSIQNDNINEALSTGKFDLFVITPVSQNIDQLENSVLKIIQNRIPLIILGPPNQALAKYLENSPSVIIGGDDAQSGVLQGEVIVEAWNSNKEILDKNKDNKIQYGLIQGPPNNPATLARTEYSIKTINDAGIETEQLFYIPCNWDYECAKINIESSFLPFANKIEAIISNNDPMAIGAIESLQKYGYNKGDNSKYIPVFGINGLPAAINLINQGAMAGTVIQDPSEYANAVYTVGMNLVSGINPLNGTNYKFDESGKIIKIPYYRYTKQ